MGITSLFEDWIGVTSPRVDAFSEQLFTASDVTAVLLFSGSASILMSSFSQGLLDQAVLFFIAFTRFCSSQYAIPTIARFGPTTKRCGWLIGNSCGGSKAVAPG